ncbi:hypothetical protein PMAYCL1PPCAC_25445, partial [Pristionchus mayeri]
YEVFNHHFTRYEYQSLGEFRISILLIVFEFENVDKIMIFAPSSGHRRGLERCLSDASIRRSNAVNSNDEEIILHHSLHKILRPRTETRLTEQDRLSHFRRGNS